MASSCLALEDAPSGADEILGPIYRSVALAAGDEFFGVLVSELAARLHVPYAWVSECVQPPYPPTRVRTLAFWVGRELCGEVEYAISGTPCEDVLGAGECRVYARDLQALFPDDDWLREIGVHSYVGVPLLASTGRVLGHLALMDRTPMHDVPRKLHVLLTFAARCAAEMERREREVERECLLQALRSEGGAPARSIETCVWCGHVHDEALRRWDDPQSYLRRHSGSDFTNGICPDCRERLSRTLLSGNAPGLE